MYIYQLGQAGVHFLVAPGQQTPFTVQLLPGPWDRALYRTKVQYLLSLLVTSIFINTALVKSAVVDT
jgi:hypothetical protein